MKNQIIIREAISEADTADFGSSFTPITSGIFSLTRRTKTSSIF